MNKTNVAVIPAYEPGPELARIVGELAEKGFSIVVVDDGSTTTASVATLASLPEHTAVLVHERNLGKGEAIKTGLRHALTTWGDDCTVVTVDADGQHDVADVVRVCEKARQRSADLVLGTRAFDGKVPWRSRLGNTVTRAVFKAASGVKLYDTQTGLRAFSGALVPWLLRIEGSRYEYEMNVLMECARAGVRIRSLGIRTIYLDGNAASHFNPLRDSFLIYREILKFSASSFVGFLVDYALFCLLMAVTGMPVFANVGARLTSACVNYSINRTMVFGSSTSLGRSAVRYAALAVCILACNTVVLGALLSLGANAYVAKVATELSLFVVSYVVQRTFIFRKEGMGFVAPRVFSRL